MDAIKTKLKILFISRAYPPVTGGIENQNYELSVWLSKAVEVKTIANRHGRKFLPIFAPYALLSALFKMHAYDAVLLGDGNLAIVGWFIKIFSNKPVICVIHGLDINYGSSSLGVWYEKFLIFFHQTLWVGFFIKKLDKFVAVGNETVRVAKEKGIAPEKIVFIPNGVDTDKFYRPAERRELEKFLGENLTGKKVILTSGRLAKRKGAAWFITEVMPKLEKNIIYVVAGDGPDKENIKTVIKKSGLSLRIKMLGYIKDADRDLLFNTCDAFVQPNIKVEGDMEGFGISVIEAASCKIPVIAADLEGLKDAIKDGQNGFLVQSENAKAWVNKINEILADDNFRCEFGEKARQYVRDNYSWEKISRRYLEEIESVISKSKVQMPNQV
ncbi:MAG: TetR family transcriptional regulator [Candidatus Moranbacteria bacterium CG_4_9_14_3_um_filter_42_9]|nr:MAG: TetR family transcriptional regulator [Candidatus Moranbacteria bacterium CG_4_9_14_3_um_filter_42_9]